MLSTLKRKMFKPCFSITYAHNCEKCVKQEEPKHQGCKKCVDFLNELNACGSSFHYRTESRNTQNKNAADDKIVNLEEKNKSRQNVSCESELSKSKIKNFDDLLKFCKSITSLKNNKFCPTCHNSLESVNKCSCHTKLDNSTVEALSPKCYKLRLRNKEYTIDKNITNILGKLIFGMRNKNYSCKKYKKACHLIPKNEKKEKNYSKSYECRAHRPRKGTLRRKRWHLNQLQSDKAYEDDLFDGIQLSYYPLSETDFDCDNCKNAPTPKINFCLTPREGSESSDYEDCYDLAEYQKARKLSEEFQYRQCKKKRKRTRKDTGNSSKRHSIDANTTKRIQSAAKILEKLKAASKDTSSSETDSDDC